MKVYLVYERCEYEVIALSDGKACVVDSIEKAEELVKDLNQYDGCVNCQYKFQEFELNDSKYLERLIKRNKSK